MWASAPTNCDSISMIRKNRHPKYYEYLFLNEIQSSLLRKCFHCMA